MDNEVVNARRNPIHQGVNSDNRDKYTNITCREFTHIRYA